MCDCNIPKSDGYVKSWRCWVEVGNDIKEFNSIDNDWCGVPDDGFQAMRVWYTDGTSRMISGNDFYFIQVHSKGLIFGQTNDLDVKQRYPGALIKRGKHIPDKLMKEVNEMMLSSVCPHGT